MLWQKKNIPFPETEENKIKLNSEEFLMYIDVWLPPILEKAENQSVKKTLTIPKWLNDEAEKHFLEFFKYSSDCIEGNVRNIIIKNY